MIEHAQNHPELAILFWRQQAEIDATPILRGIRLIINSQMEDGDFPQQVMQ